METKGTDLASLLNSRIEAQVSDDTSRSDIISQMARSAGIASGTVNGILDASINCPPINRLEGFASVLGVSVSRLRSAAESDGCEYNSDGKALFCNLDNKLSDSIKSINKIFDKHIK